MEYAVYRLHDSEVFAVRHHWGKESALYQAIENAFVIQMLDHLFFVPLETAIKTIPKTPSVVLNQTYYESPKSCDLCVSRLQKITSSCQTCEFVLLEHEKEKNEPNFNRDQLLSYLKKEKAEPIDMLALMEKSDIFEMMKLYQFEYVFSEPKTIELAVFLDFLKPFQVNEWMRTSSEIYLHNGKHLYQVNLFSGFVADELMKVKKEDLISDLESVENSLTQLTEKKRMLEQLIKKNKNA